RPPRVGAPHGGRRRAPRLHAVLPRRRPRAVPAPRPARAPAARRLHRPRVRAPPIAQRRPAERRGALAGAAGRPGRGDRPTLAEGDGPLRLARIWRNEWT